MRIQFPQRIKHLRNELRDPIVGDFPSNDVHNPVSRILRLRRLKAQLLEISLCTFGRSAVDRASSLAQQKHVVEEGKQRPTRLVYHHHRGEAQLGEFLQTVHDGQGAGGIQT